MSTWERLAELPVEIEDYCAEALQASVSSDFERKSTVIRLRGAGEEGLGEDVTYDAVDHEILQAAGPTLPLAGRFTLALVRRAARRARRCSRSRRSARSPSATAPGRTSRRRSTSRCARRGTTLHAALGREPAAGALRRLAAPRRAAVASSRCAGAWSSTPALRFKLDPTSSWDEPLIAALVATGAVDSVDFKGLLLGLDRRPARRPGRSTGASSRRSPTPGSRIPR